MADICPELTAASGVCLHAGLPRPVRFLQVTDTHISLANEQDSRECRGYLRERSKKTGLHEQPEKVLEYWLDRADREADCILLTGDIADVPSRGNLDYLARTLPGHRYLYAVGNHEQRFPNEEKTADSVKRYRDELEKAVGQPLDFAEMTVGGVKLISLDNTRSVTPEQAGRVLNALDGGMPCILCCHVPFYQPELEKQCADYWNGVMFMCACPEALRERCRSVGDTSADSRAFAEELKKRRNLLAIVTGHLHYNQEAMFSPYAKQLVTQIAIHPPVSVRRETVPVLHEPGQARWITVD